MKTTLYSALFYFISKGFFVCSKLKHESILLISVYILKYSLTSILFEVLIMFFSKFSRKSTISNHYK